MAGVACDESACQGEPRREQSATKRPAPSVKRLLGDEVSSGPEFLDVGVVRAL